MLSKCSIGIDKKGAYERTMGRTCDKPIAYIGEHIWYKPFDIPANDEDEVEPRMLEGVWLGANERGRAVRLRQNGHTAGPERTTRPPDRA